MNTEKLIDGDYLKELAGDHPEIVKDIIRGFHEDSLLRIKRIFEQFSSENKMLMKQELHTLKGSSGSLGMIALFSICSSLEVTLVDDFEALKIDQLETLLNQSVEAALLHLD